MSGVLLALSLVAFLECPPRSLHMSAGYLLAGGRVGTTIRSGTQLTASCDLGGGCYGQWGIGGLVGNLEGLGTTRHRVCWMAGGLHVSFYPFIGLGTPNPWVEGFLLRGLMRRTRGTGDESGAFWMLSFVPTVRIASAGAVSLTLSTGWHCMKGREKYLVVYNVSAGLWHGLK